MDLLAFLLIIYSPTKGKCFELGELGLTRESLKRGIRNSRITYMVGTDSVNEYCLHLTKQLKRRCSLAITTDTRSVFEIKYLVTLYYGIDFFRCVTANAK